MKFLSASALVAIFVAISPSSAIYHRHNGLEIGPPIDETLSRRAEGFTGYATFDQLIDHANPKLGTFKQRYWYSSEHWKGPGSPVYLVNPGEQSAAGFNRTYFSNQRLAGRMAAETGGALVIQEHRYWGESSPYQSLTTKNLQYLTLDNSLKDVTYFAEHFSAPWDQAGGSKPSKAPWIFTGGSYSGALAGWLAVREPGTLWAYYGSSGVVEAIGDFWQYFAPVQEATPQNCSSDVNAVVNYVDLTLAVGSPKAKRALKEKFGLTDLTDLDFAAALEWGPWQWQSGQFYSFNNSGFTPYYRFCDYVENVWPNSTSKVPGALGVGLIKALDGYAKYVKEEVIPDFCASSGYPEWQGTNNVECFKSLNASNVAYKDLTPSNWLNRQWMYMVCNEPFEWWQDGAPIFKKTLVSRLVNPEYWRKQCSLVFPELTYGLAKGLRAQDVNRQTGGWSVTNTTRLMHTNGEWDPWRDATLASKSRPGGPFKGTKQLPHRVVKHGTHCSDFYGPNWAANPELEAQVKDVIVNMQEWIDEFYVEKGVQKPAR
ncbi:Serine carboxypeptidase S28 domain containing protein [Rhypophila decipiens]